MVRLLNKFTSFLVNFHLLALFAFLAFVLYKLPFGIVAGGVLAAWLEKCKRKGVYKW